MQQDPHYDDVVAEVAEFLRQRVAAAIGYGMAVESIAIDPGIGFGKKPEHNLALLAITRHAHRPRPAHPGRSFPEVLPALAGRCSGDRGKILAGRGTHKLLSRERRADIPSA